MWASQLKISCVSDAMQAIDSILIVEKDMIFRFREMDVLSTAI